MQVFRLLAVFAALFASVSVQAAAPRPAGDAEIAAFIETYLQREVARRGIPGAAIVVVRGGKPILARGLGVADLRNRTPIDVEGSLFRQGSISKLFGWILVMQLVEEGKLELDRDINQYLDFEVPKPFGRPVTLRHLMTHSAGFADRLPMVGKGHHRLPYGRRLSMNMPDLVYAPGERVAYSNYGAALAAHIAERRAGQPFERLVEERIFRPAGMTSSTFAQPLSGPLARRMVSTYSASARRPHGFEYIGFAPAGSLTSSPADMGRFATALLAGGQGPDGRLLSAASLATMMRLQRPLSAGLPAGLGLGFQVGEYRGVRHASHGGSMMAAVTDLQLLPLQGLGWTLSFNGRGIDGAAIPLRQELLHAVIDRFFAAPAGPVADPSASTAGDVAGAYVPARRMHSGILQLASVNTVAVREAAGGELRIETENGESRWIPVARDRFVEARSALPLTVSRDRDGAITALGSAFLNGVTDYQPAPFRLRFGLPVLLATPVLILLGGLGGAVLALVRRVRRGKAAPAPSIRRWARWATAVVWLTLLGWFAYGLMSVAFPDLSGEVGWALPVVQLLGLACAAATALLLVALAARWRERPRDPAGLGFAAIGAAGAVGLSWLLLSFGLAAVPGLT